MAESSVPDRGPATPARPTQVLWDTAALAPCHPINLREVPADFICISFYKLFGHPTVSGLVAQAGRAAPRLR